MGDEVLAAGLSVSKTGLHYTHVLNVAVGQNVVRAWNLPNE